MMAKIVKGGDFKGVVDYILDKDKGTQVVAYDGLFMENKETIAMSFNAQSRMNGKVTKPVGHIALSFSKGGGATPDQPSYGRHRTRIHEEDGHTGHAVLHRPPL